MKLVINVEVPEELESQYSRLHEFPKGWFDGLTKFEELSGVKVVNVTHPITIERKLWHERS